MTGRWPTLPRLILAMLLAAGALWGGFSAWVLQGDHYLRVFHEITLTPDPVEWRLMEGEGVLDEQALTIHEPGPRARILLAISLPYPIDAARFQRIEVQVSEDRDYLPLSLSWSRARVFMPVPGVPMNPVGEGWFHMPLTHLPGWQDQIHFVAIENFGALNEPLMIRQVRLIERKPDFTALQARLLADWLSPQPWNQRSAHNTRSSLYPVLISPLIAITAWLALSIGLFLLASWGRAARDLPWLALPLIVGWLVLDMRWQADLAFKAHTAATELAPLGLEDKNRSGSDGRLVELLETLPAHGDSQLSGRVFVFGRHEYWRTRARYHLLPRSVRTRSDEQWNRTTAAALRPGDLIIALDAPLLQVQRIGANGLVRIESSQANDSAIQARRVAGRQGYQAFIVVEDEE